MLNYIRHSSLQLFDSRFLVSLLNNLPLSYILWVFMLGIGSKRWLKALGAYLRGVNIFHFISLSFLRYYPHHLNWISSLNLMAIQSIQGLTFVFRQITILMTKSRRTLNYKCISHMSTREIHVSTMHLNKKQLKGKVDIWKEIRLKCRRHLAR